jgi:hypothetical protein
MQLRLRTRIVVSSVLLLAFAIPALANEAARTTTSQQKVRVTGIVRDESNAITLPGIPVEVVGTGETVYTDVDGRYVLDLAPGTYQLKVIMDGYQERLLTLEVSPASRNITADVGLAMARFTETVTVTAAVPLDAVTSTQEAQLIERRNAQVITDNVGAQEMKANADSDAASAMSRVTGLSLVDNQYVFVRGLGERYSNTTLAGSMLPTTEPDKKVVPLDLFPTGLLDSVQVAKSYSPDRSAEFAGGLVQIQPLRFPSQAVFDVSYGTAWNTQSTGKSVLISPLDGNDFFGFNDWLRSLPGAFPAGKIVRRGIYTPGVGFTRDDITDFGRLLDNTWSPQTRDGRLGQNWAATYGNRFHNFGLVASLNHSFKESYQVEEQSFFLFSGSELDPRTDYDFQIGQQKAQLGGVVNLSYQFTPSHRLSFENLYTHSGRDEARTFQGQNFDANFEYRNLRLSFIEERLLSNALVGEHFFREWGNSRIDWRVNYAQADRDEPDLRETLYQRSSSTVDFVLADESQSGFRMFSDLADETVDVQLNWSTYFTANERPVQVKFGPAYSQRTRNFGSRRFRFIPASTSGLDLAQAPEQLFISSNIGTRFRFNEETRPVDAYDAEQETLGAYGMADAALSDRARLVAGVRVENFKQQVNTKDPFGLFAEVITAEVEATDIFPGVNFVYAVRPDQNVRVSYSQTTNRPEFRELALFEFTDVVGNRAVRGNPNLRRALIQNFDARYEVFPRARSVFAVSSFYKHFQDPIERVINAGAQPLVTFENAESARNFGLEFEASQDLGEHFYFSANYTWVDSEITLSEAARRVQTSSQRPLAGQSSNLFNLVGEVRAGGFIGRVLYNFHDERIADVGANGAPDVLEQGRGTVDAALSYKIRQFNVKLGLDNLTNAEYRWTQGPEDQRRFTTGRSMSLSFGYSFF